MSEAVNKELIGVKGWLLFFAILFTFIFPFVSIGGLFLPIYISSESQVFYKIIEASVGFFSFLTGILIFIKSSKTKIFLQIFLLFYLLSAILNHTVYADIKSLIIRILFLAVIITIIFLYFKNSERVNNTLYALPQKLGNN